MNIIGKGRLEKCARKHADARDALSTWEKDVESSSWGKSLDIRKRYHTASLITGSCVVFNIKGNSYRLITRIDYERKLVQVLWAGTHADYDKVNARDICERG